MIRLTAFRHKIAGPRGGEKIVHAVERDGEVIFDNGSRREAQSAHYAEQRKIEAAGGCIDPDHLTRNWLGKF